MSMHIRHANAEDAPQLARVMVDTYLSAHRGQIPEGQWQKRRDAWTYADSERSWREYLNDIDAGRNSEDCLYVAATEEDDIVGLALGYPSELTMLGNASQVGAIYIRQGWQRRGLGRRLIQAVAAHQAAQGRRALVISVLKTNEPAQRFYEALGGRVVGTLETEDYGYKEPQVIYGWEDIRSLVQVDE